MGDPVSVASLILQFIEFVWPFHRVNVWERGLIILCGRWVWEVGPGIYPLPWWFAEMHVNSMLPETHHLASIETVTEENGETISYGILIDLQCTDTRKAYLTVHDHDDKALKDAWAVIADLLADLPGKRLQAGEQKALRRTMVREINKVIGEYGMLCNTVSFPTFVGNMRAYRLYTGA